MNKRPFKMINETKLINAFKKIGQQIEDLQMQIDGLRIYARNPPSELINGLKQINEKLAKLLEKK